MIPFCNLNVKLILIFYKIYIFQKELIFVTIMCIINTKGVEEGEKMAFDNESKMIIAHNLKELRETNGLKGKDVANALAINPSTYRSWETGRAAPKFLTLMQIANMYNVSISVILENPNKINTSVSSSNDYNKSIYGDRYLSELENSEKLFIMKLRQLNKQDKDKIFDFMDSIFPKES